MYRSSSFHRNSIYQLVVATCRLNDSPVPFAKRFYLAIASSSHLVNRCSNHSRCPLPAPPTLVWLTQRRTRIPNKPEPPRKVKSHKVILGTPQAELRRQRIESCKQRVQEILYEPHYPRGSFTDKLFREAEYILNVFISRRGIHPEATLYALWLLDRVFTELALKDNPDEYTQIFCQPKTLRSLFEMWGLAARHSDKPPPPEAVYELMVSMQRRCPQYKHDLHYLKIPMEVAVERGQVETAKWLLGRMQKEAKHSPELQPTAEMEKMVKKATRKPWPPPSQKRELTEQDYDNQPLFTTEEYFRDLERGKLD